MAFNAEPEAAAPNDEPILIERIYSREVKLSRFELVRQEMQVALSRSVVSPQEIQAYCQGYKVEIE